MNLSIRRVGQRQKIVVQYPLLLQGYPRSDHENQRLKTARAYHDDANTAASSNNRAYQSIGSFHSDNLGMIMSLSDEEYEAPSLPFLEEETKEPDVANPADDFLLDRERFVFLNHGAFGAALKVGYHRAEQWRFYLEQQPLRYFDRDLLPHLAYSTRRLASFCSPCSADQEIRQSLTLVQNVTSALNSVIRGYQREYGKDAHILLWDTSYGGLKKLAAHVCGADRITEIPLQSQYLSQFFNVKHPEHIFLEALEDAIHGSGNKGNYLLVLDHTTSNTAINMPIDTISQWVKEKYGNKILILVDGAHGLLAQDVDLQRFKTSGIDFYVGNGHKWLSCPRGVGMLYCPDSHLRDTVLSEPAIISHGVDEPDFLSRFVWDGCRDYAAALALPTVLDYWEALQPHKVRIKLKEKLFQGIQILSGLWHGSYLESELFDSGILLVPPTLISPMALVRLPFPLCGDASEDPQTSTDAKAIQDFLFYRNIETPIKCINDQLYVRVSCHIYNDIEEFERLGQAILEFRNR